MIDRQLTYGGRCHRHPLNIIPCVECGLEMVNQPPTSGAVYGIVDPDYARVYTQARIIAWQYGYACVMHGSFTRDLDLLMVPWEKHANNNHDQILRLLAEACGLRFKDGVEDIVKATVDWTEKPHGRKACSLYFPAFGDRRWVDISFFSVKEEDDKETDRGNKDLAAPSGTGV